MWTQKALPVLKVHDENDEFGALAPWRPRETRIREPKQTPKMMMMKMTMVMVMVVMLSMAGLITALRPGPGGSCTTMGVTTDRVHDCRVSYPSQIILIM